MITYCFKLKEKTKKEKRKNCVYYIYYILYIILLESNIILK